MTTTPPLAQQLEHKIRANRLYDLSGAWAEKVIFPAYDGLSLRNIPHTIADILGAPFADSTPLEETVWQDSEALAGVERVVLFLMDGFGYKHLLQLADADPEIKQLIDDLTQGRGVVPLTSTAPSTTAVALTSLWTGGAPGQSGIFGTIMHLRELSTLGNMLTFRPTTGKHPSNVFEAWGYPAGGFSQRRSIAAHLSEADIPSYVVQYKGLMGTGLSGILHGGVSEPQYLHTGYSDFHLRLEDALIGTRHQKCYLNIYWAAVDTLAHMYGAHNQYTAHEAKTQLRQLRDLLKNPDIHDGKTLFILTADHGHYDVGQRYDLMVADILAPLRDAMILGLSGDGRLPFVHVRPGTVATVKEYLNTTCGDWLIAVETDALLAEGFYGVTELPAPLRGRVGDLVLIPRLDHVVEDSSVGILPIVSWHAGLSDWEMLIPLMWQRF